MKLDHPTARKIWRALFNSRQDVSDYARDEVFIDDVQEKTEIFYRNPRCNRSKSDVVEDTFYGELCERALADICKRKGLNVTHNVEGKSGKLYWDVEVEGALIEVKLQNDHNYFSFPSVRAEGTLHDNWNKIHLIVVFYTIETEDKIFAVPWLLIDSHVMGSSFWKPSNYENGGHYLDWTAEHSDMLAKLNPQQNNFTL